MRKIYFLPFFLIIVFWSNNCLIFGTVNNSMNLSVGGNLETSYIKLDNGTTGSAIFNYSNTSANITINYLSGLHDHVLNISEISSQNLYMKLRIESVTNLSNLNITTIYFKNASGNLITQIRIENGTIKQNEGTNFEINALQNIPLVVEEDSFNSEVTSQIKIVLISRKIVNAIYYEYQIILDFT